MVYMPSVSVVAWLTVLAAVLAAWVWVLGSAMLLRALGLGSVIVHIIRLLSNFVKKVKFLGKIFGGLKKSL